MADKKQISERKQRQNERMALVHSFRPKPVRVVPANDEIRKRIKHPNGMGFRPEGSVEWPNDRFTKRRLKEGVVTLEESKEQTEEQQRQGENPKRRERTRSDQDNQGA
ncbi:hypothetical protein ACVMGC_001022 [Bradyrhizobium barranii subsp. barranii]|uniref:hypothetical protein n=1 Tax=Bradyrhizobium TaxID=374 RepID=UPI001BA5338B|nr:MULTISPECIES: hypothetical protein [Bradyrhizobium]MBR0879622.1 hypothetical protein [Bradyrhizobium liaoningense]MCP1778824.1 hypothetical protein [Bradyrhizobium japonicum]MCP1958178.1 hypothetical protein [Bradyrhizobium japonicum]